MKRTYQHNIVCAIAAVIVLCGATSTSIAADSVVAEQTPVTVVLDADLKSGDAKEGSDVPFHTATDIYTQAHVLAIPAGAKCWGVVRKSAGHGAWGKAGKLDFSCDYVDAAGGVKVPLRSQSMAVHGKDNTNALVGGIVLLGVFGGFVKGRDVTVHAGTSFTMYVDADTHLGSGDATTHQADLTTVERKAATPAAMPSTPPGASTVYGGIVGRKIGVGS